MSCSVASMDSEVAQLHSQADHLLAKFQQAAETSYIEEAIDLDHKALELCPRGHAKRFISLTRLAMDLCDRYKQLGSMSDLEEAIVLDREALELCPQDNPGRLTSLNSLAASLSARYKQLGATRDLDEAILLGNQVLGLCPHGHPDRSTSLNNLASFLFFRYLQLGAAQDLNEAIVFDREALDLCQQGHPYRSLSLNNLAVHLSARYKQLGSMKDLNEAIVLYRAALALRPRGHPLRSTTLTNLAADLSTRFNQLEAIQDLNEAIVFDREALELRPQGHHDRSVSLSNLAVDLAARFNRLGAIQDINEVIILDREALDLRPQGHPDRSISLSNLAFHLFTRDKLETMQDLNEVIALNLEALKLRPQGHPLRSVSLRNLAFHLFRRHERLGGMQDLNLAIILGHEALKLYPQGSPDRSVSLKRLAVYLRARFIWSKDLRDIEGTFNLYSQLKHVTQIASSNDLSAARGWISAAEEFQHPTLLLAYETALRFLVQHLATLPSLPQHFDILKQLTSSLAMDAFSACLRNRSPRKAVELLEQGRGVFWSQLIRLRSPLEDVIESGTEGSVLAEEFMRLASLIRNALNSPGTGQHEQVFRLNLEIQEVVTEIRELPGHSSFLLPSRFSDLQCATNGGPVIIVNASQYSCDALIIMLDRDPVHIPFKVTQEHVRDLVTELRALTKRATKGNVTKALAFFLRKLWDQVVSQIVDFLQTALPRQSRIWWCPTAEFSQLPLHAAGPYRKGQINLPNLYISSYTPTLAALARQCGLPGSATLQKSFVAIGQGKAAGESELLCVGEELANIGKCVDGLATFTRLDGEESCIANVVDALSKNEWVHLACHGLPNRTHPFESAFALHDGHFTIQQIIKCDLKNPEFAYLSACHTIAGDEQSPDEVIHLASAMQFAGFRSVIGTMWAVDDGETNKITSTLYEHMVDEFGRLDHTRAAFALNKTMRSVNVPFDQRVLYIHIGA